MFTSFTNHFFRAVWHVRTIILALIALVVAGAAVLAYLEKIAFSEALYFAFVTGLTSATAILSCRHLWDDWWPS